MKKSLSQGRAIPSWLVTGLICGAAVVYTLFLFLPQQRKTSKLKAKKFELMQYVAGQQQMSDKIAQAERRQREVEVTTARWLEHAPKVSEVGRHLSSITTQAHAAGVTIQRFDPQPQVAYQTVVQQAIVVAVEGNFEQVFDFLHRVETMPHKVGVTNLSLNGASEDAQTLRAEMTLTIFADLAENSGSAKST
jgi:Tfp pilus assembly protein PilO